MELLMSRTSNRSNIVSMQQSPQQTDPGLCQKRMSSTRIRRLGPKRPDAWFEKSQSGNPVRLVETLWSDALAVSKASVTNTVIPMPQARDRVSMPSLMQSLPLQMNVPTLLCLPHPPLRRCACSRTRDPFRCSGGRC